MNDPSITDAGRDVTWGSDIATCVGGALGLGTTMTSAIFLVVIVSVVTGMTFQLRPHRPGLVAIDSNIALV